MLASQSRALQIRFRVTNLKKLERKTFALGWRPWPGKGGKNAGTCSHCDVTHKEPKLQGGIFFFSISRQRLAESVEGLINSLALLVGKL